jgi:hypothetical protein
MKMEYWAGRTFDGFCVLCQTVPSIGLCSVEHVFLLYILLFVFTD